MRLAKNRPAVLPVQYWMKGAGASLRRAGLVLVLLLSLTDSLSRVTAATAMIFCNGNLGSASG